MKEQNDPDKKVLNAEWAAIAHASQQNVIKVTLDGFHLIDTQATWLHHCDLGSTHHKSAFKHSRGSDIRQIWNLFAWLFEGDVPDDRGAVTTHLIVAWVIETDYDYKSGNVRFEPQEIVKLTTSTIPTWVTQLIDRQVEDAAKIDKRFARDKTRLRRNSAS